MKLWRMTGAVAIVGFALLVIVPLAVRAAHELLVPATVGVVLYLLVRVEKHRLEIKVGQLEAANADVLTERDAINTALGAAMDTALEVKRR